MKTPTIIFASLLLLPLSISQGFASEAVARVIKSENMPEYPAGYKIQENTQVKTSDNQRLALKTSQGDTVTIGENSNFKVVKPGFFSHFFGKIYYFIRSRNSQSRLTIESPVATIGIRGTKFIISSSNKEEGQILLDEGRLNIESNDDEPFVIATRRELTEFERYKLEALREMKSMKDEYEDYKKQLEKEFKEYKNSFILDPNTSLSFDGKKVDQSELSQLQRKEIDEFEAFLADTQ